MHVAVDDEDLLQKLQQNDVIDGAEDCHQVEEN